MEGGFFALTLLIIILAFKQWRLGCLCLCEFFGVPDASGGPIGLRDFVYYDLYGMSGYAEVFEDFGDTLDDPLLRFIADPGPHGYLD